MKLADHVVEYFAAKGIDKAFVVYGSANGDIVDAFTRVKGIEYVCTMHEQAGGFAAEGWAKVKGLPGLVIVTSGPGAQNLVTPVANCYYDSVPCIFITGQVSTKFQRPHSSVRQVGFQETDVVEIMKSITKWSYMVKDPRQIGMALDTAWQAATTGRPGPVVLDLPIDVQRADITPQASSIVQPAAGEWSFEDVRKLLTDLQKSERPVLLVGGGARNSRVLEFSRRLGIPAYPTWNALDIVTSDFEHYGGRIGTYGGAGRNFGLQNADMVIAIGCRISGRITGGRPETFARAAKRWMIDIDPVLLDTDLQPCKFENGVWADAGVFVEALLGALPDFWPPSFGKWRDLCIAWRNRYDPVQPWFFDADFGPNGIATTDAPDHERCVHPYAFARTLSEVADPNAIVVTDCGGNVVIMNHAFQTKQGQRFFSNNGNSPMGFSYAGALGAWFAAPDRQVICVIGDGGMTMNSQELQTQFNYKAKVKTFIIDNRVYGITKAFQRTNFGGRFEACGPKGYAPPEFMHVARAYGLTVAGIPDNRRMKDRIEYVLSLDEPVVCVVSCPEFSTYEPRIFGWDTPIEDMYPYLPREEFRANMLIDPVEGWQNPAMPNG